MSHHMQSIFQPNSQAKHYRQLIKQENPEVPSALGWNTEASTPAVTALAC